MKQLPKKYLFQFRTLNTVANTKHHKTRNATNNLNFNQKRQQRAYQFQKQILPIRLHSILHLKLLKKTETSRKTNRDPNVVQIKTQRKTTVRTARAVNQPDTTSHQQTFTNQPTFTGNAHFSLLQPSAVSVNPAYSSEHCTCKAFSCSLTTFDEPYHQKISFLKASATKRCFYAF